ncbi:MAG: PKD-like domain-containing protein [Sphingobacteriales bacterium]
MKNSLLVFLFLVTAFRGYSQCTLSVNLSSSGPAICSGSSVVLTSAPSGGIAPYTYIWSDGETTSSISVNKAGTYSVTVSDKTPGCAGVKQSITIASATTPNAPTAANVVACPNAPATLTATAPGGTYQWYDAATGGNFLASGASYVTPPIIANTVYYVETTVGGCTSTRTPVLVTVQGKPLIGNATICSGDVATLLASGSSTYAWYASASGGTVLGTGPSFTTPPLIATTVYYVIATSANGCVSQPVAVTAFVTPPPQPPTAPNATICSGTATTLHATSPSGGVVDWFAAPTGGTSLISSPDYTTPGLATTTTYYIQTTVNTCVSTRTPVTVTVNSAPTAPVVPAVSICSGGNATLTPTGPGGTYTWYNAAAGGILLATGPSYTTPALTNSTTYYVQVNNGGCTSPRTAVNVTVTQLPSPPSASGAVICSGSTATLTATSPGGIYQWYDAATAGNLLVTNASLTTPVLNANTIYYVQTTVAGCTSARTPVTVSVQPQPSAPAAAGATICSGNTVTLTATGPSGNYAWYDAPSGGNFLANGQVYVTPVLSASTTYYVEYINSSGCPSAFTPVAVVVNPPPTAPVVSGTTICPGTQATLTATAPGIVTWYDAATGGTLLATGNTFTTPVLNVNITYYVEQASGGCTSTRTPVVVLITPFAVPQFKYPSGTFCPSASNPTPVINNPSGGTFSASPAGLVFVSATTGQINLASSAPGTYTVAFAGNGSCPTSTTANITISASPNAQFSYSPIYCQSSGTFLPTFSAGASSGVFSASPIGLHFVNTSTGEIDPVQSTPGTYTVTNTIAASGSCPASTFNSTITINQSVTVTAGPDQSLPSGTPVNLAGTISGGATTGTWSGGTGSFSNPNSLNTVYTPGASETSATLTLTSADPAGPCSPAFQSVTITFVPIPAAPTAAGAAICSGDVVSLSATAPGGIYKWYDAATGGNLLSMGPTFTTPALTVNTTYYVQTTLNGATSSRTPVAVTINPISAQPVATGLTICSGTAATLTATGSAGGYQWYDAPTGGNLLATSATYVTTFLAANTSYYVESVANGCPSSRVKVDVTVSPIPAITSSSADNICSGVPLAYTITANVPGTTFNWSRAAVAGISNLAVSNQATSSISEILVNTGSTPVIVTYVITPTASSCPGNSFNYVVTVNPAPTITSQPTVSVCNQSPINYNITFNSTPGIGFGWSRAAVAGISNAPIAGQDATTIRESLLNTTSAPINVAYVITYGTASCTGLTFNLVVTVNPSASVTSVARNQVCSGEAQNYAITSNIAGSTYNWSRAAVAGISNPAVTNQTSSTITEALNNVTTSAISTVYVITPIANGCPGAPFVYVAVVNPAVPTPLANSNSPVCVGTVINLQSPIIPNAVYNWSGPNGFTSISQNPSISNVTISNSGTYNLFITINGCTSTTVSVPVVVNPPPVVDAGPPLTECTNVASVQLGGSVISATGTGLWSTNGTGTFSPAANVLNAQYIPSAADIASGLVTLTLSSTSPDNCNLATSNEVITFKAPIITSAISASVCSGTALNYPITSDFPTATFTWSRAAVANISNPAVSGQTSGTITETLINTGASPVAVVYIITPVANGCSGTSSTYTVSVNPIPVVPVVTANSPVCVNSTINLQTPTVSGAVYAWTGPNGYTSAAQNPSIASATAADAGTYTLSIMVNGCTSANGTVNIVVDPLPVSKAGQDQVVCPATNTIQLAGTETGGTPTGQWSTSGTGTFSSNTALNAQYFPSAADITAGSVKLTLASTSADNCAISTSSITVKFQLLPAVTAGPDQSICSQGVATLGGQIAIPGGGVWSSSGTGTFSPSANQLISHYIPSPADIASGSVVLTLTANGAGQCYIPTDKLTIKLIPPPTVSAGNTIFVLKNHTATLSPTVSDPDVTYSWSPNIDISSTTIENPEITGNVDRTYTLTVTDSRGCQSSATVNVVVSPLIVVPNTFTPNGDGVNDQWNIQGLTAYQQATVDVFDRNGQKIFHSVGYGTAWDGTYKGQQVPYGVYYYIIDPKTDGLKVLSGSITVVR